MVSRQWRQRFANWCGFSLVLGFLTFPLASVHGAERIRLAYSAISGTMAPIWVTYEAGFFSKYGLDVQLIFVESGTTAVQTMLSGDVAAAEVAGSAVLQSNLRGSGVVMIAGFINTMNYQLMVDKNIKRPDQLKGKAVAVSRFGSSSDFATRYALEKFGLVPEKDVAVLQIGTQPARLAALEAGKIQGVMLEVPHTIKAKKMGFNVLADLQMLGLEYQHTGLAATQALIKSRPDLVRNIMKAFVEGIHYYKTHRKESIAILAKYLKSDDPDALAETYEVLGLTLLPEKPYPTLRGIEIMLREMAIKEPKAQAARPEQFVDVAFIRDLDRSGVVDALYKSAPVVASREEKAATGAVEGERKGGQEKIKLASKPSPTAPEKAARKGAKSVSGAGSAQEYTVKAGDTLSRLAQSFYGTPYKWEKIYDANREAVKNPNYIYIGQKLMIPTADGAPR